MSAATARVATRPAARPAARPSARPAPRPAPRPRARPVAERKRAVERGLRGGILWIVFFGLLLAGVVGVNLAVLRQNMQLDRLADERVQLREQNLELSSQLSQLESSTFIERRAQYFGLKKATTEETTYIQLGAGGK